MISITKRFFLRSNEQVLEFIDTEPTLNEEAVKEFIKGLILILMQTRQLVGVLF